MLYGRLLYGNNAYNEEILFAHGTVEGFASAAAVSGRPVVTGATLQELIARVRDNVYDPDKRRWILSNYVVGLKCVTRPPVKGGLCF